MSVSMSTWGKFCTTGPYEHDKLWPNNDSCPLCKLTNPAFQSDDEADSEDDTLPVSSPTHHQDGRLRPNQDLYTAPADSPTPQTRQPASAGVARPSAHQSFASITSRMANSERQSHNRDRQPAEAHAGTTALMYRPVHQAPSLVRPKGKKAITNPSWNVNVSLFEVMVDPKGNPEGLAVPVGKPWLDRVSDTLWDLFALSRKTSGHETLAEFFTSRSTSIPDEYRAHHCLVPDYQDTFFAGPFYYIEEPPIAISDKAFEAADLGSKLQVFNINKSKQRIIYIIIERKAAKKPKQKRKANVIKLRASGLPVAATSAIEPRPKTPTSPLAKNDTRQPSNDDDSDLPSIPATRKAEAPGAAVKQEPGIKREPGIKQEPSLPAKGKQKAQVRTDEYK